METAQEQHKKQRFDYLREYRWQKGQSGNPGGRPKGAKSMKTWAREFLESMSEDARVEFMESLDPDLVWKMAEGNPHNNTDITSGGEALQPILVKFIDGESEDNKHTD